MQPIEVTWAAIKNFLSTTLLAPKFLSINNSYLIHAFDGPYCLTCVIVQDGGPDQIDFETNYKPQANATLLTNYTTVTTQYELNNKYLSLAKIKIPIANNVGQIRLKVPGQFGNTSDGRYIAGGDGWLDSFDPDDYLLLDVFDDDRLIAGFLAQMMGLSQPLTDAQVRALPSIPSFGNLPGYPLVGTYNDTDLAIANQGWYFWALSLGGTLAPQGEIEFEPIAGYGYIPAGLYVVVTITRPNVSNGLFRGNLFWGAPAPLQEVL